MRKSIPVVSVPFHDLFSLPPRNGLYKSPTYQGYGVKLVKMNQLFSERQINANSDIFDRIYLTEKEKEILLLQNDDLLFSRTSVVASGVGKCSIVKVDGNEITWDSNIIRIRLKRNIANPSYYFYYFNSPEGRSKVTSLSSGSAITTITGKGLASIDVPLPSLVIQNRVVSILKAYDDLIDNNTRRIAILEEMAQALYREWFVESRFPGHEQARMVESPLGPVPEGWAVKELREIADVNAQSIGRGSEPEVINYVDISSVSTGRIDAVQSYAIANAPGRARRIVKHGDIIWAMVRPNRRAYALILNPIPDLIVSTGFAVIATRGVPYTYLYKALTTDTFAEYLTNNATGSAYPAVNAGDFEKAKVLVPSPSILKGFHCIVSELYEDKENMHKRNAILKNTRDLLLPRLITGELLLPSEEQ
ncbi:MAG: restriction endonuclease subunit S [Armatimonadota bacterium]